MHHADFCSGNLSIHLDRNLPYVITYGYVIISDGSEWFYPHSDVSNCSWLVVAPNDSVIEVNVVRNKAPDGPRISVYSDVEGTESSLLYDLQRNELGVYYSNFSTILIEASYPIDFFFTHGYVVSDVKLTAYEKQGKPSKS